MSSLRIVGRDGKPLYVASLLIFIVIERAVVRVAIAMKVLIGAIFILANIPRRNKLSRIILLTPHKFPCIFVHHRENS